jgi:CubicO group peptidase (beta-lactamase class C family)
MLSATAPTSEQLGAAAAYSRSKNGVSYLVVHQGKVLAEEYPNGGNPSRAMELASATKSFCGVMALCAQEDGLLKLEEPVGKTITEWQNDDRKNISIHQLLTLCSGIPGGPVGRVPSFSDAILTEPKFKPGVRFQYGPAPFMIFGELMRRKLKPRNETVLGYLERRVFKPIGLEHGLWRKDKDGNPHLPSGAHLAAREWIKFGEMVRQDGKGVLRAGSLKPLFTATTANPSYALTWWLPGEGGFKPDGFRRWPWSKGLPADIYVAGGAGGQRLYVIPSRSLTIIRQAPIRMRDDFEDAEFLKRLLLG